MKKLPLISALFFANLCLLFSQDEGRGKYLVGGGLRVFISNNISSDDMDIVISPNKGKYTESGFAISPYAGKYISNKFIVGILAGYGLAVGKYGSSNSIKETAQIFSGGLFARYLLNPDNKLVFQLEPALLAQLQSTSSDGSLIEEGLKNFAAKAQIAPLISYGLSPKLNLVARLGALQYVLGYWQFDGADEKNTYSHFSTNFNLAAIQFGVELKI